LASPPVGQRHGHRGPPASRPPASRPPRDHSRPQYGLTAAFCSPPAIICQPRQLARLRQVLAQHDPTDEIGAAWGCKELLRQLLAETNPERIRHRLWRFYDACAHDDMAETTRLATTIETWWPAIHIALTEQITNARTEGFNRIIKQVKRVGCRFPNMDNYQRRIMAHIAVTRPRGQAA
jgi:hypothetical protein